MAKSTFNDCHTIYRQTRTLSRAHRLTLIGWLQQDAAEKPAKVSKKKKGVHLSGVPGEVKT